jgi:hypothetical protein
MVRSGFSYACGASFRGRLEIGTSICLILAVSNEDSDTHECLVHQYMPSDSPDSISSFITATDDTHIPIYTRDGSQHST